MSDLISRSELINALKVHFDSCFREDGQLLYSDHICTSDDVVDLINLVENQHTAYDVDKVVEELETDSSVKLYGSRNSDNYMIPVNRAIEIVKQSGAGTGTEAETIRDQAIKWNNNSTKKVPYEFIEFVEGKHTIDAEDDVCEWNGEQSRLVTFTRFTTTCGDNIDLQTNSELLKAFRYCPFCGRKLNIVGD